MQIEIKLDENCKEPKIIVVTNKMTDEINEIMKRLSDEQTENDCRITKMILSKCWSRLIFTAFLLHQAKCLPKQITVSTRSVCGFTKWSSGWTATFLSEYQTRILSI